MNSVLITLFLTAFFINLIYETVHSVLYTTCLKASLKKCAYLVVKGAVFDGTAITAIYVATYFAFGSVNIFHNCLQLVAFLAMCLALAYVWEVYSLRKGKWEYAPIMPLAFGVGLTPLIQLAVTGLLSLYVTLLLVTPQ